MKTTIHHKTQPQGQASFRKRVHSYRQPMTLLPFSDWSNALSKSVMKLALVAFLLLGWNNTTAQVSTLTAWTNQYHGTGNPSVAVTIPAGSGTYRVLVLGIASSQTGVAARTATVTYGGQTLTLAAGDMATTTTRQHTALYYLLESGIEAATSTTLAVTFGGGTVRVNDVWTSVYDYVDQTTPITNFQNYNSIASAVSTATFGTGLTVNENEKAITVISSLRSANTGARTLTAATNWTLNNEQTYTTTDGVRNAVASRSITATTVADVSSTTLSGTALASMTGISLNALPKQFRSAATGTWGTAATWQQSMDNGTTWVTATTAPSSADATVTIRNGDTVTLGAGCSIFLSNPF